MANEELSQRGYFIDGRLRGTPYGSFEELNLGATSLAHLLAAGLPVDLPAAHGYAPIKYKATIKPASLKPDALYLSRADGSPSVVAVCEHKPVGKFSGAKKDDEILGAMEQALLSALALGAPIAIATDSTITRYVNVAASKDAQAIVEFGEFGPLNPGKLLELSRDSEAGPVDPTPLAERVWQLIWHATKAEPKDCLLTFVEIFMLKFLTDNLQTNILPAKLGFYALVGDAAKFKQDYGLTEIEYYVAQIRPKIKSLFPDNTISGDSEVAKLFGMETIVSKTSVINGFVFLKSGTRTHESYNSTFRAMIDEFEAFGPLVNIDPEFKLRLYETFLQKSARLQPLGQFFTPRNVVRSMVAMAQLNKLEDGDIVLDPAAGVGGFVLEPLMWSDALKGNVEIKSGKPHRRVRTVGIDVDPDLHVLAKANTLIHLAEMVRDPATTPQALNKLMAETFVLMDHNKTLGALMSPPRDAVSVVLTNPPYVTRGSAIYKETMREIGGPQNGVILKDYYDRAGLGVEALFLRYISGALKPGGRAFVIVPQGLLNRTEPGPKQQLLDECNILASIQLPRNTFFNTAQKTYILVLERRHTPVDPRPDVLCGIARSIGESLDWRRTPEPEKNDLADIASAFVRRDNGEAEVDSPIVKIAPASDFGADDRWDVVRFWAEEELVDLGESSPPVARVDFITEARDTLEVVLEDLKSAQAELEELTAGDTVAISIGDAAVFSVHSGTRITTSQIREHAPLAADDAVTVYSCFRNAYVTKGEVSRKWLGEQTVRRRGGTDEVPKFPLEDGPTLTVNANGASVGKVFVRPAGCLLTDDVIAVKPLESSHFDLDFLSIALQNSVAAGGYLYEAKLFVSRVKELQIHVPVDDAGRIDLEQQTRIASATKRFESTIERMAELGLYGASARFV